MLRIGITGGIGSGKSTVAHVFEVLGIPVYYADREAKKMMNEDAELKEQIVQHFGADVYSNGLLNRKHLASLVFDNKERLALLNSLVHPATIRHGLEWMARQSSPYALKEAALIFESGSQEHLDYVIGVSAPLHLRIQRAMNRDNVTREEVLHRMKNQIQEEIKMRLCDFVIKNDEQELVIVQVLALDKKLKEMAEEQMKRTLTLYRPVGPEELKLIEASGFSKFPPRLPEQPIFYPVLNQAYAEQIAREWNVPASGAGYVTKFEVDKNYIQKFNVQNVGSDMHDELWVPAEELEEFNSRIAGKIEVIKSFPES